VPTPLSLKTSFHFELRGLASTLPIPLLYRKLSIEF
jgi:hypothetical protein